ncbi:CBM96 family carbohydrate-binding protein [Hyalangium gracile]|uniref:CBM96 family carbohydrate-binding protein n=1 Tax=Hyalangium gracile TaxID=394092 RepID=UPI001CCF3B30|nr:DNRLRE domain-containing protein [Hyalangium gracile]
MGLLMALGAWVGCGGVATDGPVPEAVEPGAELSTRTQELGTTVSFAPVADARVEAAYPDQNFGAADGLYTDTSPAQESYLRFSVRGLSGPVTRAVLRLYVTNGSSDGPSLTQNLSGWGERSVTWNSRPSRLGAVLADLGSVAPGSWAEYDLTPVVTGNGDFDFTLFSTVTDGVDFASREHADPALRPQLVVTTGTASADIVLSAAADAYVEEAAPNANRGSAVELQIDGSPRAEAYVRFEVPAASVTSRKVTLRVYAFNGSSDGPALYTTTTPWSEQTVTWNTRPSRSPVSVGDVGAVPVDSWVEYDVTSIVRGGGSYGFALVPTHTDGVDFHSRESAQAALRPQLVISMEGSGETCSPEVRTRSFTYSPLDDTQVSESSPGAVGGASDWLYVDNLPRTETYFRFGFDSLVGRVKSAKLRVFAYDGTGDGPAVYQVDTYGLSESTTTWANRPARIGPAIADVGSIAHGSWVEVDVTRVVQRNGIFGFALVPGSADGVRLWSKEYTGNPALRPRLEVITESTVTCESERVCDSGSCWFMPMPHGMDQTDTWGSSPSNIWATGPVGSVLHWDGTRWRTVPSGTSRGLLAIWGTGPQNIWAVGEWGSIARFNGTAWTEVRPSDTIQSDLRDVFGTGPDNIWAVGLDGTMLHFDGTQWRPFASGTSEHLYGVWASSPTDVWVVGARGLVRRWNGTTWAQLAWDGDEEFSLRGVFGFGPNDVWVMGNESTIRHWDGTAWTTLSEDSEGGWFAAAWGSTPNDVWFVGLSIKHWDGSTLEWAQFPADDSNRPDPMLGIWGTSPQDAWAVGWSGSFSRLKPGRVWKVEGPMGYAPGRGNSFVYELWGDSPDNAWAALDEGLLHWDGAEWTWLEEVGGYRLGFYSVWGSGPNDVWASSAWSTVAHFDGTRWKYMYWDSQQQQMKEGLGFFGNYPNGTVLYDIWGTGANDVWFVGPGLILHWNGTTWTEMQLPSQLNWLTSVHGSGPNDVWAVGSGGTIFHFDGVSWTDHSLNMADYLEAVWVASPTDTWAVGSSGMVLRWNGTSWTRVSAPTFVTLNGIHGTGPNDVWAVGEAGTLLHWDGTSWTSVPSATRGRLYGVFATGTGKVWFSGFKGAVLRR